LQQIVESALGRYEVLRYIHCGGTWVEILAASRDLINQWVRRLRR
jgi:hypothetical protein